MGIALSNQAQQYQDMSAHIGHQLRLVSYAGGQNVAIECETCYEVLVDCDRPEQEAEGGRRKAEGGARKDEDPGLTLHPSASSLPDTRPWHTLRPHPLYPRDQPTREELEPLVAVLRGGGALEPITILPTGTIVDGVRRWLAYEAWYGETADRIGELPVDVLPADLSHEDVLRRMRGEAEGGARSAASSSLILPASSLQRAYSPTGARIIGTRERVYTTAYGEVTRFAARGEIDIAYDGRNEQEYEQGSEAVTVDGQRVFVDDAWNIWLEHQLVWKDEGQG